jgi:hypothetical protein
MLSKISRIQNSTQVKIETMANVQVNPNSRNERKGNNNPINKALPL